MVSWEDLGPCPRMEFSLPPGSIFKDFLWSFRIIPNVEDVLYIYSIKMYKISSETRWWWLQDVNLWSIYGLIIWLPTHLKPCRMNKIIVAIVVAVPKRGPSHHTIWDIWQPPRVESQTPEAVANCRPKTSIEAWLKSAAYLSSSVSRLKKKSNSLSKKWWYMWYEDPDRHCTIFSYMLYKSI